MGLYLRQLLAGRDFARDELFAYQMANFVYLIGDDATRECMVVDPAWDIEGIIDYVNGEGMELVGALVTHYHPDHIGGDIFGHSIAGLSELMETRPMKVYVNEMESEGVRHMTGLSRSDLAVQSSGSEISMGGVKVRCLHTPGHTPGSQCFLVEESRLVSGDTLFIGGCGRVDLPGGDPEQMYYSLTNILAKLPESTLLFPGHNYADRQQSTIGEEKMHNYYLKIRTLSDWLKFMGKTIG